MTNKELSNLYHINKEVERLTCELDKINRAAKREVIHDSVKGSYSYFPYTEHSVSIAGIPTEAFRDCKYDPMIAEIKQLIELNIKKSTIERDRLDRYIVSIDEPELRQIFAMRYINGLSWMQVAKELKYADESAPRKRHDRYLQKNKNDRLCPLFLC